MWGRDGPPNMIDLNAPRMPARVGARQQRPRRRPRAIPAASAAAAAGRGGRASNTSPRVEVEAAAAAAARADRRRRRRAGARRRPRASQHACPVVVVAEQSGRASEREVEGDRPSKGEAVLPCRLPRFALEEAKGTTQGRYCCWCVSCVSESVYVRGRLAAAPAAEDREASLPTVTLPHSPAPVTSSLPSPTE